MFALSEYVILFLLTGIVKDQELLKLRRKFMKKVSVVVPCYNAAEYLDQCITQLLRQTIGIEDIEIILVDDASTDSGNTQALIMKYEKQFPDTIIAVLLEQNLRQGGARNVGVSYASGEYITFCDADDWLLEEALEHSYDAAKEYNADVVEFSRIDVETHGLSVKLKKGEKNRLVMLDTEERKKQFLVDPQNIFGSQNKLFRLSLILENQILFAEHLIFEEPSFMVQVWLYEKRHYFLDEQLYICFLSPDSTMRSNWEREHKWDNLSVWVFLMDSLLNKGMLEKYRQELEYLFFDWGFGLSLCLPFQKSCELKKEDVSMLVRLTTNRFPDLLKNPYVLQDSNWNHFLRTVLERETVGQGLNDADIQEFNAFLKRYIGADVPDF